MEVVVIHDVEDHGIEQIVSLSLQLINVVVPELILTHMLG